MTYDGKGGAAFVVEYNNQAAPGIGYRLFWINAKRQLATKDFTSTELIDVLRATPKGLLLQFFDGSLVKAARDKSGTITLQPFGVNGEPMPSNSQPRVVAARAEARGSVAAGCYFFRGGFSASRSPPT